MKDTSKTWAIVVLMAATLVMIYVRGGKDRVPPSEPLAQLPDTINSWHGHDLEISPAVLAVLGHGDFLSREYTATPNRSATGSSATTMPIGLFIGYFPTQRSGQSIHSPQNCLPGAGWSFDHSGVTQFEAAGRTYRVGEYLISNGESRDEVLYWYRAQGQDIANDYSAKFHMIVNSIVKDRTDAALIRVMTPVQAGETVAQAHDRVLGFTKSFVPMLGSYIPD
jgi:EpsI family protein